MSYERIVRQYQRYHRPYQRRWLRYYKRMRTLPQAIRESAAARGPDDRKFSHQWSIPARVLGRAKRNLAGAAGEIRRSRSFDALHDVVRRRIGNIFGIGELTVYDTSLRIGAFLGRLPRRVYLHAGAKDGYRAMRPSARRRIVRKRELPNAFQELRAYEIEDLLCVFRDELAGGTPGASISSCYSPSGQRLVRD